ncbi:MAG: phosphoribosyltransferase family protein [Actinomycetota bacterium]
MFDDRIEAGRHLAARLGHLRDDDVVVVGLPRGGVPVAAEVARALDAPLDVILVRKLGLPFQAELAMGAIGEGGARFLREDIIDHAHVSPPELAAVERRERRELDRRARVYRGGRDRIDLAGRTAVIVDDGVATGSTARVACQVARLHGAKRIVLAVPVAPPDWVDRLADVTDELIVLATPLDFQAIRLFYRDFAATSDEEVIRLLAADTTTSRTAQAADDLIDGRAGDESNATEGPPLDADVVIPIGAAALRGHLMVPPRAAGLVVFVHGSGSSRHSPRNRFVADVLHRSGLATLLFDLLTEDEELQRRNVFDVDLLASRLMEVSRWAGQESQLAGLPIGYFGASTGAAAALTAAAVALPPVAAVVSRGGRPDLARGQLDRVRAPTLLIVGADDREVLYLNKQAASRMGVVARLEVIPGATHLFEEPGTLRAAAERAREWFLTHLTATADAHPAHP